MHYYQFNIGDYASHTRHLTIIEDIAYRRLLDLYYLHEQPLDERSTVVARLINMRENEAEVAAVLLEFFQLHEGVGWINSRADAEIAKFHSKQEQASRAGKASAERRSNARSTDVQPTNNQEPITNISPTDVGDKATAKKPPRFDFLAALLSHGVSEKVAVGWLAVRKAKKAPNTEAALDGFMREVRKAGITADQAATICIDRNWQGFNAGWDWKPKQAPANNNGKETIHDRRANTVAALTGYDARKQQRTDNASGELDITGFAVRVD